ncbi:MAG: TOBE domain-containing protein, partial [Arthrobacter sp.]
GFSAVPATIEEIVYTGPTTRDVAATAGGDRLIVQEQTDSRATAASRGDAVELQWPSRFNFRVS